MVFVYELGVSAGRDQANRGTAHTPRVGEGKRLVCENLPTGESESEGIRRSTQFCHRDSILASFASSPGFEPGESQSTPRKRTDEQA